MRKYGAPVLVGIVVVGLIAAVFAFFRPVPLPILSTVYAHFHYPTRANCRGKTMNGHCYIQ